MTCTRCGCEQIAAAQFCRQCGTQQTYSAAAASQAWMGYIRQDRVRQNIQPLGIMWMLYGGYRIFATLLALVVMRTFLSSGIFGDAPWFVTHMMRTLFPVLGIITVMMGLAAIATGYGLLMRQPWARVAGIVLGILALIKIPFGTALGVYTLWVLAPRASGDEWATIAPVRSGVTV